MANMLPFFDKQYVVTRCKYEGVLIDGSLKEKISEARCNVTAKWHTQMASALKQDAENNMYNVVKQTTSEDKKTITLEAETLVGRYVIYTAEEKPRVTYLEDYVSISNGEKFRFNSVNIQ